MPLTLKKRTAPTATDSLVSEWRLENAQDDGASLSSDNMPLKKRAAPTATASLESASTCWLEDGLDDGASLSSSDKPTMHSSCRRRLSSVDSSSQETDLRDKKNNDPKCLPLPIDALVDEMICVKKDHDRAEMKELCSKLFAIIHKDLM